MTYWARKDLYLYRRMYRKAAKTSVLAHQDVDRPEQTPQLPSKHRNCKSPKEFAGQSCLQRLSPLYPTDLQPWIGFRILFKTLGE